jgi:CubicO group peptidase (beta-lactamase class C family)
VGLDRTPVPTADELGLMRGTPPPPDRLVTLANWMRPPYNRWALQHVSQILPTAPVRRGGAVWELPRDERDLGGVGFELDGEPWTVGEMARATAADAILVLHQGAVVWEAAFNAMPPHARHLCFSVSKSILGTVAGVLVGERSLDPAAAVTAVLPELAGTAWDGVTVRHLLDMRAGIRWDEAYAARDGDIAVYRQAIGWWPRRDPDAPEDAYAMLAGMEANRPHGGAFDYRTPLTSMLGWVCERASGERLPDLVSRALWLPLGVEHDAAYAVDPHGNAVAGSGFQATLADLARFAELWRLGGVRPDGTRIVPEAWVHDTLAGDPDSVEAFRTQADGPDLDWPDAMYRNQWWVLDPGRPLFGALGIHGQFVTVDPPSGLVVAIVSSRAVADDADEFRVVMAAVQALGRELAG